QPEAGGGGDRAVHRPFDDAGGAHARVRRTPTRPHVTMTAPKTVINGTSRGVPRRRSALPLPLIIGVVALVLLAGGPLPARAAAAPTSARERGGRPPRATGRSRWRRGSGRSRRGRRT